jgi:hypothetical protein
MIRRVIIAVLLATALAGIAACANAPDSAALDRCEDVRAPPDGNCYAR